MNTSTAAKKRTDAPGDRQRVLAYVVDKESNGTTCDEAEVALGLIHQTCAARFRDLELAGRIRKTSRTRPTRTGAQARVYIAAPARIEQRCLFEN